MKTYVERKEEKLVERKTKEKNVESEKKHFC